MRAIPNAQSRTVQKVRLRQNDSVLSRKLTSLFKRSQFCFKRYARNFQNRHASVRKACPSHGCASRAFLSDRITAVAKLHSAAAFVSAFPAVPGVERLLSAVFCVADSIAVVLQVPRIDKYNANIRQIARDTPIADTGLITQTDARLRSHSCVSAMMRIYGSPASPGISTAAPSRGTMRSA